MNSFGYSMPAYFQNMPQVGAPCKTRDMENESAIRQIEQLIDEQISEVLAAGRSDESLNKSGQMTAMQRIRLLVDEGSWCPMNSLYNPGHNEDGSTGVITGLGRVNGRWVVVIASDNKKLAGAWVPGQPSKLVRATDMAKRLHIPVVCLINCSGVKLDIQEQVYAGRTAGGTLLYRNAQLQQLGVPVISGIYGTNPAGGGYQSISSTVLVAHEKANIAVGGAGIVGGMSPRGHVDEEGARTLIDATSSAGTEDPPGSVACHYSKTGFFREVYAQEEGVIAAVKKYVDAVPAWGADFFRVDAPMPPQYEAEDLYTRIPLSPRRGYDIKNLFACVFDGSRFMEYRPDYGPEIIAGLAKVDGQLCAVIANRQGIFPEYPEYRENSAGIGGRLYRQGLIKMNEFVTLCARDRIPLIWMQDTTGVDVGDPAEEAELLGLGQALIYSTQNADIPQMELTLRKGTAAAHYVMGGPQGENNVFSIGVATTEIYVMHGETAAAAMYARRLVKDDAQGKDLSPTIDKMNEMIRSYDEKSRPLFCAQAGLVDEIVKFSDLRRYLCAFVGAAWQNAQSVCAFHQMLTPRVIREHSAAGQQ